MNSKHCPNCNSIRVIKKGKQSGRQRYLCKNCNYIWRRRRYESKNSSTKIWNDYALNNLSIMALMHKYNCSERVIRDVLDNFRVEPPQSRLSLRDDVEVIILDATYIEGRKYGLLVVIDALSGEGLYAKEIFGTEKIVDYEDAIKTILPFLPNLKTCVIDGRKGVREMLLGYGMLVQHCQFHQIAFITHKLSRHPKSDAGKELRQIALSLTCSTYELIKQALDSWEKKYQQLIKEKTYYTDKAGKKRWHYTHRNLRSSYNSLRNNLQFLFTYQEHLDYKIPNTSNRIDGLFGVIKRHIRTHSGCSLARKIQLWYFFFSVGTGVKKYQK